MGEAGGVHHCGKPNTCWWISVEMEAMKLKMEAFKEMLTQGSPAGHREGRYRREILCVGGLWMDCGEGLSDGSKNILETVWHLKRGRWNPA